MEERREQLAGSAQASAVRKLALLPPFFHRGSGDETEENRRGSGVSSTAGWSLTFPGRRERERDPPGHGSIRSDSIPRTIAFSAVSLSRLSLSLAVAVAPLGLT